MRIPSNHCPRTLGRYTSASISATAPWSSLPRITARHSANADQLVGHNRVFDVQLRVPLIVRLPTRRHQEIGGPVQLIDLLPTLLGMLGVEAPEGLPGMDLRPAVARGRLDPQRLRYAENGKAQTLRMDQRWTLIMDQGIPRGLYDLRADPEETEDLIEQHPEIADRLRGAFEQFTVSGDPLRSFPDDLSEEEIDRLRSLGYLR